MRDLNRSAAESLSLLASESRSQGVHAATDVTGFGLAGHAWELAQQSGVSVQLDSSALPIYDGAHAAADAGVRTGGDARNRSYLADHFQVNVSASIEAIALDPQTSGGLLVSVAEADARKLVDEGWWQIGEISDGPAIVELR